MLTAIAGAMPRPVTKAIFAQVTRKKMGKNRMLGPD
jgi:hypothetical protein